jgi:hypothetical protein
MPILESDVYYFVSDLSRAFSLVQSDAAVTPHAASNGMAASELVTQYNKSPYYI